MSCWELEKSCIYWNLCSEIYQNLIVDNVLLSANILKCKQNIKGDASLAVDKWSASANHHQLNADYTI